MSEYSQAELQGLWTQAGGPSAVAPLMAAIAMAESGGNSSSVNASSGACGLWQIHPCEAGANDPMTNARIAVRKYQSQGLGAWEAYTNGSYKRYYTGSASGPSGVADTQLLSSGSCHTQPIMGNCADSFVAIGAMLLGAGMILVTLVMLVMSTREFKDAAKTGAKVAMMVPK